MKMLRIVSKRDGFRRCGVAHSGQATDYPMDRFSKKDRERLEAEDMLVVHEVEVEGGETKTAGRGGGNSGNDPVVVDGAAAAKAEAEKAKADADAAKAEAEKAKADADAAKAEAEKAKADAGPKAKDGAGTNK